MGKLTEQVAVITGGGRGQGRSHALALAREGARVAICDIDKQVKTVSYQMNAPGDLAETARLVADSGGECLTFNADVRDFSAMEKVVNSCIDRYGRVDIVVANAGCSAQSPIHEMPETLWRDTVDINLHGAFNIIRAAVPHMVARKYGRIVATASTVAQRPIPNACAYVAAKCGVIGLVKALAVELGQYKITANALCPSVVTTGMAINDAFNRSLRPDLPHPTTDDAKAALENLTLLRQAMSNPEDVSEVLMFLVTDPGRLVTGVAVDINPIR